MDKILQKDAPTAILQHRPFEAGSMRGEWRLPEGTRGGDQRYVVSSYEDTIGYWTPPTEVTEGYWTIHWSNQTSPTTLRHTRILDRAVREWAHAVDTE